jgi:hypothetical protein
LLPAIEGAQKLGLPPKKALADTAYGSAENHQQAAKLGVELIAPVPGKKPQTELSLADFSFSDDEKVSACPQGQVPFRQSLNKKTRTAFFTHSTCDSCSKRSQSPVLDGKKGRRLCYDSKQPGFCPLTLSNRSVSQETGRFELLRNYHSCRIPLPCFIQGGTLRHIPCKLLLAFAALLFSTALSCLKNPLGVYAAAVHFIFQLDHRRPIQVPN